MDITWWVIAVTSFIILVISEIAMYNKGYEDARNKYMNFMPGPRVGDLGDVLIVQPDMHIGDWGDLPIN